MEGHYLEPSRQFEDTKDKEAEAAFLAEVSKKAIAYMEESLDRSRRITDVYASPEDVKSAIDITVGKDPITLAELSAEIDKIVPFLIRTGHPRFYNQLFAGQDAVGVGAQWFSTACNTSVYTYEMAPVFSLMETEILTRMRELVGWAEGAGDGIFVPGGSYANLMAINVARHVADPSIKEEGMAGKRVVVFTSAQAHYSMRKACSALGLGSNNCVKIDCDEMGRMIPAALEAEIVKAKDAGAIPACVVATAGSTVTGAFDPIKEIVALGKKHSVRVHVDAAWGGMVLFSRKHKHLVEGIHEADSVTWNPHKFMGTPQQCSVLLTKVDGELIAAHSAQASYLFQKDKMYAELDTGDKTLQCGRLPDVFKLWCAWKVRGNAKYEEAIDKGLAVAEYLRTIVRSREGYEMAIEGQYTNVCFYHIPKSLRGMAKGPERDALLQKVPPYIKARMQQTGTTMVGYQPIGNLPQFFRMVNMSPRVTNADMDKLLDIIEEFGAEWDAKFTAGEFAQN